MSTCISRQGEFSEHTLDDSYTCTVCHVLDEDALRAELARLRAKDAATTDWRRFDYDNRDQTKPPNDDLVWINEEYYDGVTPGYYDGGGWWCTYWGSDDCHVSHWAPLTKPEPPSAPSTQEGQA